MSALVHRLRPASGDPVGALVMLHGSGADEADLEPLPSEAPRDGGSQQGECFNVLSGHLAR